MRILPAMVALLLALPSAAQAADIVINNGLAPPNPANVINDGAYSSDWVHVRNVGCPPGWPAASADDPCPEPWGDPTEVEVVLGAVVDRLYAYDSSTVAMSGGEVRRLVAYDSSTIPMNGGTVSLYLRAYDSSTFTMIGGEVDRLNAYDSSTITMSDGVMGRLVAYDTSTVRMSGGGAEGISLSGSATVILSGGTVSSYLVADDSSTFTMNGGEAGVISSAGSSTVTLSGGAVGTEVGDRLVANDSSTVTIIGNRFRVDGGPVPYGDLSAQAGTLTGTLESEDPINIMFYQGGWTEYPCTDQTPCSGTIRLAPPLPALSSWGQLALAAGLLGAAALRRREMPLAG